MPATPGADLRLSIDIDLQRATVDAFGELDGPAVAVDPRTGEILAMVSLPTYDPNLFVNGISHADYQALNDNPSRPLFNRNVLGGVAPGSTHQAAARAGRAGQRRAHAPRTRPCRPAMFRLGGQRRGYRRFASAAATAGPTCASRSANRSTPTTTGWRWTWASPAFDEYLDRYGFGKPTGIDLSGEIAGILPSPEWKATNAAKQGTWYPGDTVISGIGQGFWKVDAAAAGAGHRGARQRRLGAPPAPGQATRRAGFRPPRGRRWRSRRRARSATAPRTCRRCARA